MAVEIKSSNFIKKDYEQKQFRNPYFEKQKKAKKFNTGLYLKIITLILVVYVLIYSDLFQIKTINVSGHKTIETTEVLAMADSYLASRRWFFLPQKNWLFLNQRGLGNQLEAEFNLSSLVIKRGWQKLDILLTEKTSGLIVHDLINDAFFLAGLNGEKIKNLETPLIEEAYRQFPVFNLAEEASTTSDRLINGKIAYFVVNLHDLLKESGLLKPISYEIRESGSGEIAMRVESGWTAYFDVNNDYRESVLNLLTVLNAKIKNQKIEYIDLRFGDKIYYQ